MTEPLTFFLPLPPSVNALYSTNWKTKRRFPSKRYQQWKADALEALYLARVPKCRIAERAPVLMMLGRPDRRVRDASNYEKAIGDMMKHYGIVLDDSLLDPITIGWTDEHPGRVKITITRNE